jgi:hypothetical protein
MIQQLTPLGVDVPGGFAVSSDAYDAVLDQAGLRERLQDLMKDLDGTLYSRERDDSCTKRRTLNSYKPRLVLILVFQSRISTTWQTAVARHAR